jgi:FMN phosphatase YigB (HAD superfamily)
MKAFALAAAAALTLAVAALTLAAATPASAQGQGAGDWLFFDLGQIIVDGNPTDGYRFVPGALDFLRDARAAGYKTALITNIPETWGATCAAKFAGLQTFLGDRLLEETPLDWRLFDAVVMPPFDRYRKPERFMFLHALSLGCGQRALFVGENAGEVAVAAAIGYATFMGTEQESPYPALTQVPELLTAFHFQHPDACDYASVLADALQPEDAAAGVTGCAVAP